MSSSGEKIFHRLCCLTNRITLFAQTDKKGYIPGENIILCGSIINHSHHRINSLCTKLIQKAMYANCSEFPTGESQRVLVEESYEEFCDRSSSVAFSNKLLSIPSCAPSGLPGCDLIDIKYFVCIEAEACVWLPIDIGVSSKVGTTIHDQAETGLSQESTANLDQESGDKTPYVNSSPDDTLVKTKTSSTVSNEKDRPNPSKRLNLVQFRKSMPSLLGSPQEDHVHLLNRSRHESMMMESSSAAGGPDLSDQLHVQMIPMTHLNLNYHGDASSQLATNILLEDIDTSSKGNNNSSASLEDMCIPILTPPPGFKDQLFLTPVKEEDEVSMSSSRLPGGSSSASYKSVHLPFEDGNTVVAEEFSFLSTDYF